MKKTITSISVASCFTLLSPTFALAQEDTAATEEVQEKKKFAKLRSKAKKSMMTGLRLLEKGKVDEEQDINEIAQGVQMLVELGEGIIPKCISSFPRMAKVDRLTPLREVLDKVLVDEDLHLALALSNKSTSDEVYAYLMKRWADSSREDCVDVLTDFFTHGSAEINYHCTRGLINRSQEIAIAACVDIVNKQWVESKQQLRIDFSGSSRGLMSDIIKEKITTSNKKARLLGLHLFELFGLEENAYLLKDNLNNSDTALRLGAINACRVVVAKEQPLLRPSMTELIELATEWSAKL